VFVFRCLLAGKEALTEQSDQRRMHWDDSCITLVAFLNSGIDLDFTLGKDVLMLY
jgi:hypothetical protein